MLRSVRGAARLLGLMGMLMFAGCSSNDNDGRDIDGSGAREEATGGVDLALLLADGSDVSSVQFVVARNGISVRTGTLAIDANGRASGIINGLDAGAGYVVSLEAPRTRDGGAVASCSGASPSFTVFENLNVPISIVLQCDDTSAGGNIAVNGQFNVCPKILSASATPIEQYQGGDVTVTVSATDKDGDVLSYAWFQDGVSSAPRVIATTQTATVRCAAQGTMQLNVAVGDIGGCRSTLRAPITIRCVGLDFPPPPPPPPAPLGVTSACNSCLLTNCNPQFGFMYLVDDCVDSACEAAFACFQANRCAVDPESMHKCYCGDVPFEACRAAGYDAVGPCADLVERGLGTTVAEEVLERFVDSTSSTGDGLALFACAADNCAPECLLSTEAASLLSCMDADLVLSQRLASVREPFMSQFLRCTSHADCTTFQPVLECPEQDIEITSCSRAVARSQLVSAQQRVREIAQEVCPTFHPDCQSRADCEVRGPVLCVLGSCVLAPRQF